MYSKLKLEKEKHYPLAVHPLGEGAMCGERRKKIMIVLMKRGAGRIVLSKGQKMQVTRLRIG